MRARSILAWTLAAAALAVTAVPAVQGLAKRGTAAETALRATGRAGVAAAPRMPDGTVSVNSADLYDLTELPGVGETLADRILSEREAHGPFFYPEDLMQVKGIGQAKLAGFWDLLDMSPAAPGDDDTD